MYCGMLKGTCRAEAMSNSEKIKPVALAVIELNCLKASVSQSVTCLLTQSVSYLLTQSVSYLLTYSVSQLLTYLLSQ